MSQSFGEQWTWDECCEKLPAEFMPMEEWITSTYESYEKPGEDGNPTGFATTSHRMEPYGEAMTIMGRTGGPAGASFWDNYVLPPASVDYLPLPRYEEPAESPVTDTEFPTCSPRVACRCTTTAPCATCRGSARCIRCPRRG